MERLLLGANMEEQDETKTLLLVLMRRLRGVVDGREDRNGIPQVWGQERIACV